MNPDLQIIQDKASTNIDAKKVANPAPDKVWATHLYELFTLLVSYADALTDTVAGKVAASYVDSAITALKGGVAVAGDTLAKLYALIQTNTTNLNLLTPRPLTAVTYASSLNIDTGGWYYPAFSIALTGNLALNLSNSPSGQVTGIRLTADGTDRTVTLNAAWTNEIKTLIVPANKTVIMGVLYNGSTYNAKYAAA